jgi:hypothetical protein
MVRIGPSGKVSGRRQRGLWQAAGFGLGEAATVFADFLGIFGVPSGGAKNHRRLLAQLATHRVARAYYSYVADQMAARKRLTRSATARQMGRFRRPMAAGKRQQRSVGAIRFAERGAGRCPPGKVKAR